MNINLRKQISYSLQYCQYLSLQIEELKLHSVIEKMIYKYYIICGSSIIEGVFCHLLKSSGNWNQKQWEIEQTIKSPNEKILDKERKLETIIYKKVDLCDGEMNFDSMIKKIEKKKLLDIAHQTFPYIKHLKRLRNKIHLQINEHNSDTDWYNFGETDFLWMKYTLYKILANSKFNIFEDDKGIYSFLKPSSSEIETLKKCIMDKKPS